MEKSIKSLGFHNMNDNKVILYLGVITGFFTITMMVHSIQFMFYAIQNYYSLLSNLIMYFINFTLVIIRTQVAIAMCAYWYIVINRYGYNIINIYKNMYNEYINYLNNTLNTYDNVIINHINQNNQVGAAFYGDDNEVVNDNDYFQVVNPENNNM